MDQQQQPRWRTLPRQQALGPLAIPLITTIASTAIGAGVSALMKPKTPPVPTPPAPEQAFTRPNSLMTPGTGNFNGTFFGGSVAPGGGGGGGSAGGGLGTVGSGKSLLGN
jgi:hypothetical protein